MPPPGIRAPSMGVFTVRILASSLEDPGKNRDLELTVDTGATYPGLPRPVAEGLDAQPAERRVFVLADGQRIERDIGYVGLEYEGRRAPVLVVLGEPGDAPLLGAVALEILGYEADPGSRTLRPVTQYMMTLAGAPHLRPPPS